MMSLFHLSPLRLRSLQAGQPVALCLPAAYDYADSAEHREGIHAFLDKRTPRF